LVEAVDGADVRSVWIAFDRSMAKANAEHNFAFIPFDCSVSTLAVFVTHFGTNVRGIDPGLLAGANLCLIHASLSPLPMSNHQATRLVLEKVDCESRKMWRGGSTVYSSGRTIRFSLVLIR